jgi:hypothetical protein
MKIKVKGIKEALQDLDPKTHKRIIMSTTNKLARRTLTELKREFVRQYAISQKNLELDIKNANMSIPTATISAPMRQKSLSAFRVKQTKAGVAATVRRGKVQQIPHAFMATVRGSYKGVFLRRGSKRFPLRSLYALSIGLLLKSKWVEEIVERIFHQEGQKLFNQNVSYYMNKMFKS